MAERRMFAKSIITSDAFLDMPVTARCLYFYLMAGADDDGFVNRPRAIMRECGAADGDARILLDKRFILAFDDGVIVIKHWRIHNYIRSDRYQPTKYMEHKSALFLDDKNAYTEHRPDVSTVPDTKGIQDGIPTVYQTDTNGIPTVSKMDTEDRIGKDSIELDKDSKDNNPISLSFSREKCLLELEYKGADPSPETLGQPQYFTGAFRSDYLGTRRWYTHSEWDQLKSLGYFRAYDKEPEPNPGNVYQNETGTVPEPDIDIKDGEAPF